MYYIRSLHSLLPSLVYLVAWPIFDSKAKMLYPTKFPKVFLSPPRYIYLFSGLGFSDFGFA
jgi:hypothetical protein